LEVVGKWYPPIKVPEPLPAWRAQKVGTELKQAAELRNWARIDVRLTIIVVTVVALKVSRSVKPLAAPLNLKSVKNTPVKSQVKYVILI
jgi:hypothetical protein